MKIFILSLAFSMSAISAPPMGVSGQGDSSNLYPSVIKAPFKQITNLGAGKAQVETGNKNRVANPGFEHATYNSAWLTETPTGSATQTIGVDTTTPLEGLKSLTFQCAGGASGGTCTIYQDVTTSYVVQGRVSALIDTDVVWDGTNGARLHQRTNGVNSTTDYVDISNIDPIQYKIPSLTGTTSTGVALVITAAASQTINVEIDDAYLGTDAGIADVSVITPWQSYTPTFTGLGTVTSIELEYRQNGTSYEIRGSFVTGTVAASAASFTLPNSGVVKSSGSSSQLVGSWGRDKALATTVKRGTLMATNAEKVIYFSWDDYNQASSPFTALNGNTFAETAQRISITASIPIANLSGSTQVFASNCGANCENVSSAKIDSTGTVTDENVDFINGNCTNANPKVCTFNAGVYTSAPTCTLTTSQISGLQDVRISAQSATSVSIQTNQSSDGVATNIAFNIICTKSPPDYQSSRTIVGSFKDTPKTTGSSGSDIQSVYFGSGANCNSSNCTTGTCSTCRQVGSKITSVTWAATGVYRLNGIDGTKYHCSGTGNTVGTGLATCIHSPSGTSSYAEVTCGYPPTGATDSAGVKIDCIGVP